MNHANDANNEHSANTANRSKTQNHARHYFSETLFHEVPETPCGVHAQVSYTYICILGSSARFARAPRLTELYYGIILREYITELDYGIILRDNVTESYYGIIIRDNIM